MNERIEVSAKALRELLTAFLGTSHDIRELQATMTIGRLTGDHPIIILRDEYDVWVKVPT
jgi:hypothetical protein